MKSRPSRRSRAGSCRLAMTSEKNSRAVGARSTLRRLGDLPQGDYMTAYRVRLSRRFVQSEGGAILIQVAIASVVLIAFTSFVVDYGILWVSRREAQNAADAGAMAGAVALAFDNFTDRTDTGPAKRAA